MEDDCSIRLIELGEPKHVVDQTEKIVESHEVDGRIQSCSF